MRHNHILAASLLGGLMILSAACVKEKTINDQYRPVGSEIRFSAATVYNNGAASRTEYSGYINNSNQYERINWVKEDPISIVYKRGTSTASEGFKVTTSITPDQEKSRAEIEEVSDKLYWADGTADHEFFAMYPTKGFKNNETASLSGNHVEGAIPNTQIVTLKSGSLFQPAMEYGYMVAYKKVEASSTATTVELPFCPAMTAFQFRLSTQEDNTLTVSSFEMSSNAKMAGKFAFDITGGNDRGATWGTVTTSNTSNSIKVTFSSTAQIKKNQVLDFTVFALPVDMTQVTIKLNFNDGTSKRLELRKNASEWFEFKACKKYLITNTEVPSVEIWDYYIDNIPDVLSYGHLKTTTSTPFQVTSYKVKRGTTTKVPVSWKIQYSTDGSSWSNTPDDKQNVNITAGGGGTTLTVNNGANVVRDHTDSEKTGDDPLDDAEIAALRTAPDIPDAAKDTDGYYDLSKHLVYGSSQYAAGGSMETANCYVVQRPGLYKFPLVYGNAIKGGSTNTPAFNVSSLHAEGDEEYFLPTFRNHDDQPITDPWIKNNKHSGGSLIKVNKAIICWQDVTESNIIIEDADVSVDGDYVKFEVKRGRIRPGNVVIAAMDGNTIVWSWHIWVTEKNLTPHGTKDYYDMYNGMMDYNLGWTDATSAKNWKWVNWDLQVRVTQDETGGTSRVFHIKQIGDSESIEPNVGSNTFYQWGRKDPMLPAASTDEDKPQFSSTNREWKKASSATYLSGSALKFGHSIQNPNLQYVSRGGNEDYYDGNSYFIGNLWDSGLKNNVSWGDNANRRPVKTVYDPCPPGYVVPNANAFTYFAGGIDYTSPLGTGTLHGSLLPRDGYNFRDHMGGNIFFPFCGARAHDGNHGSVGVSIYDVTALGYYWTSCPNRYNSHSDYSGVEGRRTSKMMIMTDTYIRACHEQRKGACYAVRPVEEDPEY